MYYRYYPCKQDAYYRYYPVNRLCITGITPVNRICITGITTVNRICITGITTKVLTVSCSMYKQNHLITEIVHFPHDICGLGKTKPHSLKVIAISLYFDIIPQSQSQHLWEHTDIFVVDR